MGWDAYAISDPHNEWIAEFDHEGNKGWYIPDAVYARAFKQAEENVLKQAPNVDGLLAIGGLDCSNCGYAMQNLTGIDAWGKNLSIKDVQALIITEYIPEEDECWAYCSALQFLLTCKEQKLGIRFSW